MAVYNFVTDVIKLNDFRFSRENPATSGVDLSQYNTRTFDGYSGADGILFWQLANRYAHKKLLTDLCTVYVQTQANFPGSGALPYPDLQLLDVDKNVIADLSVSPYIMGAQQIAGNNYTDKKTGIVTPLNTYCWQFRMGSFIGLPDGGIYYLRITNTAADGVTYVRHLSEPIFVYGNTADYFPNTVLITATNNSNRSSQAYIFDGWTDHGFHPTFYHRVEGYVTEFDPKGTYISYLQQEYEQNYIDGQDYRSFKFELGGTASGGVPAYLHEKIAQCTKTDIFTIENKIYQLDVNDSDGGIKALWSGNKPQTVDRRWPSIIIRERDNGDYVMRDVVTNPCVCPVLYRAYITKAGETYTVYFEFDMTDGFSCPFHIDFRTMFSGGTFNFNSLADFTSHAGDIYIYSYPLGGRPEFSYGIFMGDVSCGSGTIEYGCVGPVVNTVILGGDGMGGYKISTDYVDCGTDCHKVDYSYSQIGGTDSGVFSDTVSCPPMASYSHAVAPSGSAPFTYHVIATDCCGNIREFDVTYSPVCDATKLSIVGGAGHGEKFVLIPGGGWKLFVLVANLGGTCDGYTGTYVQTNSISSGVPDSGTFSGTYSTTGSQSIKTLSPNLTGPFPLMYHVEYTDCCGGTITSDIYSD